MPKSKMSAKSSNRNQRTTEQGSNNVFTDLGFSPQESASLMLKCTLMDAVEETIKQNGWTQREAARKLGVHQPRISDLYQGHIDLFSVDTLVEWLDKLGKQVRLTITDKSVA